MSGRSHVLNCCSQHRVRTSPRKKVFQTTGRICPNYPVCMSVLRTAFYGVCTEPRACLNTARKRPGSSHTATGSWALLFGGWGGLRALVNSFSESQAISSLPTAPSPMPPKGEGVPFPNRLRRGCGATRKQMSWVSLHPAARPRSLTLLCPAPPAQESAWLQPGSWSPLSSSAPPNCPLADGPAKCCPRSLDSVFWRGGPVPASPHLGEEVHR